MKRVRKCITVDPLLLEKVKNILRVSSYSETIELSLKYGILESLNKQPYKITKREIENSYDQFCYSSCSKR